MKPTCHVTGLFKETVVYTDIPWQTVVYQLYTTAQDFDVAHAKYYIIICNSLHGRYKSLELWYITHTPQLSHYCSGTYISYIRTCHSIP